MIEKSTNDRKVNTCDCEVIQSTKSANKDRKSNADLESVSKLSNNLVRR